MSSLPGVRLTSTCGSQPRAIGWLPNAKRAEGGTKVPRTRPQDAGGLTRAQSENDGRGSFDRLQTYVSLSTDGIASRHQRADSLIQRTGPFSVLGEKHRSKPLVDYRRKPGGQKFLSYGTGFDIFSGLWRLYWETYGHSIGLHRGKHR